MSKWTPRTFRDGKTTIPGIGFGTGRIFPKEHTEEVIKAAITAGFEWFDASPNYRCTEEMVGKALRETGSSIFLSTKYEGYNYPYSDEWKQPPREQCLASLERLGRKPIDLYMIHNPSWVGGSEDLVKAWKEMETLMDDKLVTSLGVSNCKMTHLETIKSIAKHLPSVNQIPFSPHHYAKEETLELLNYMRENQIIAQGFSPLTPLNRNPMGEFVRDKVTSIGTKYGRDAAAVLFAWTDSKGVIPLTGTRLVETGRMVSAINTSSLVLTQEEIEEIDQAGRDDLTWETHRKAESEQTGTEKSSEQS